MNDEQRTEQQESEQIRQRRANFEELQRLGVTAYPHAFAPTDAIESLVAAHGDTAGEALEASRVQTRTAGRILAIRSFGKANFLVISDGEAKIQVYLRKDALSERDFALFKLLDFGDFVGVEGHLFRTKTNELTIWASRLEFLAKCFIPLPEKWHGLQDVEIRYRQRYLDLIVNPDARRVFETRSRVLASIRTFLNARGYLEVETPMMQAIAGGALARPFVTHHNALDLDLYLRIAPELYLKRLVVGGFERVFELNRNFRNEGISTEHNPEFTMLEFYQAYATFEDAMALTEELFAELATTIAGGLRVPYGEHTIDFTPPWSRLSMKDAVARYAEMPRADVDDPAKLRAVAEARKIPVAPTAGYGKLLTEVFEKTAEASLIQPTFIVDFPTEVSPLARQNDRDPSIVDRFELYVAGRELANGFSELNDPDEQRARFEAQLRERARGDDEAHQMDEDYIRALEHGMPPAAGEGIGIDRLVMLLTNSPSIRDVILFPQLRPERK